jgi:hypothetical protein
MIRFLRAKSILLCFCIIPLYSFHARGQQSTPLTDDAGRATYHLERITGGLRGLQKKYTGEQLFILQKLNRRDLAHLARADSIIVPYEWRSDELFYSPFPEYYDWAAQYPKALVVHHPGQAFAAYENGRLVRWGPVSSGRKATPTPSGLFHLNWKSKGRQSSDDPDWYLPWYFNFENKRGFSFHQFQLPGYPASHACERLLEPDAVWLYEWGEPWTLDERGWEVLETGTPVLIIGQYGFGFPAPWMSPEWAAKGIDLPHEPVLERSDR